jgi:hypothetical protein
LIFARLAGQDDAVLATLLWIARALAVACRGHHELVLENLALRQQLQLCLPESQSACQSVHSELADHDSGRQTLTSSRTRVQSMRRAETVAIVATFVGGTRLIVFLLQQDCAAQSSATASLVGRPAGVASERSGRAAFVAMMEATDLRDRHDGAVVGRRDRTRNRRVSVQRQVRTGSMVVRTIEDH